MSRALVLVWMGTAALRQSHAPDLEAWSGSRQVVLEAPAQEAPLPVAGHDDVLVARIEGLLAEARTAAYGAEPAAAEQALANAELVLRGNPELPEAPWLMSETCLEHGALVKSADPALAAILLRRARALGGARATAFAQSAPDAAAAPAPVEVRLEGPEPIDDVYLDGVRVTLPLAVSTEEHHVRVERRGRLAWAGWITPEGDVLRIPVPPITPCSPIDLEGARLAGDRVEIEGTVLCPEWAVARDAGVERVEVAVCRPTGCGALLPWTRAWGRSFDSGKPLPAPPPVAEHKGSNAVLWTAVTVGAVLLTGSFVAWRAGAFDDESSPRTGFRITGPGAR